MAFFHGKEGKVTFTGGSSTITKTTGWTLDVTCDTDETTSQLDTFKSYLAGLFDFTAGCDGQGRTERPTIAQLGSGATLALYINSDNYFDATAICTGVTETANVNAGGKLSYRFEGNDATGLVYH